MKLTVWLLFCCVTACAQPNLDQRVRAAASQFHISLYAKNLDTGVSYGLREDEPVRTASTIKLPIMTAVFDAVEHGRAKWSEPLTLTGDNKVSGTGVVRELSNGVKLPIIDLVHLMIVVSDNTATNLILDRFTADTVNAYIEKLGLKRTRSLRKVMGNGKTQPSGVSQAGRLPENQRYGLGVSTPHEMVRFLEMLDRGEVVSAAASKEMTGILKRQQYRDGIARSLIDMPVASKTGSLDHLRSDVAIVYSPRGKMAMAITVEDIPKVDYSPDNPGLLMISKLAQILLDGLGK